MSSSNKLNRALDSLRKIITKPHELNKQKEKINLYLTNLTITDIACKSNEKSTFLTYTVSSLIMLLEEADPNTRLSIDESLNKIIRASMDNSNYVAKILIALLQVLGMSSNEKCLKAALWRFSKLAHFVRPQKGKIYVQTLVPIIMKIAARKEESIVETLAESLPNIFKHIGLFCSDNDFKRLLKTFLKNLSSDSVEIRRAAASSIAAVCKHSRQPDYFFTYVMNSILDLLIESKNLEQESRVTIQGCLSCIRQIFLHVSEENLQSVNGYEYLLQVYELCLFYAKYHDHNVVTSALETLYQLFQQNFSTLMKKLCTKGGLNKSTIRKNYLHSSFSSLAADYDVMSINSTIARTEDGFTKINKRMALFGTNSGSCSDLNSEQKHIRTEEWLHEQPGKGMDTISSSLLNINTSHFANSDDEEEISDIDAGLSSSFRAMSVDNIQQLNDVDLIIHNQRQKFNSEKSISMSIISSAPSMNTLSIDLNIGEIIDENDVPLNYCARFLVSAFLIENQNSKKIRVSILSLTLNCLARLFKVYPTAGSISVEKNSDNYENYSHLLDVILSYVSHEDQQIRGLVCVVIGNFLISSLIANNYSFEDSNYLNNQLFQELLKYLSEGLQDESSVCVKHTLSAVSLCLTPLLSSSKFKLAVPLLDVVFGLVDNPYWLIKVKILDIIGELSFELLYYVNGSSNIYQDRILQKIIIVLLGDIDGRVRSAAAKCLTKFIKSAYYPMDHEYELVCITYGKKLNSELITPYEKVDGNKDDFRRSLTRVVHFLKKMFKTVPTKYAMAGCVEALCLLSQEYPPIEFNDSWQCFYGQFTSDYSYSPCELFESVVSLVTNSTLLLNFDVHSNLLKLGSQLFAALCYSNGKLKNFGEQENEKMWSFLGDNKLKNLTESFLQHLMRVATIFNDLITNATVKFSASTNLQPLTVWPLPIDQLVTQKQVSFFVTPQNVKNKFYFKLEDKPSLTQYNRSPLYLKFMELLRSAYNNYGVTLKSESSEVFVTFMKTVVDSFSAILNYVTITEADRIAKDLLLYLRNFLVFIPVPSVRCVIQLLRSVFGSNQIMEHLQNPERNARQEIKRVYGFYEDCFQLSFDKIKKYVDRNTRRSNSPELKEWDSFNRKNSPVKTPKRNVCVTLIPSYIKLFEPNVIQSLRQYTVSSDTELQAEVLVLLSELIQLKINYCLLDSEQVFMKFVLSQFQLIEEGQLLSVENLLPQIFKFLIYLASEKHSKPVMSVPKVIQLCDSLIASGQAVSQCILAINPVVKHVFLKSSFIVNSTEIKELETQRDVLFTIVLKLLNDPRSLELIVLILNNSEDEVKLKRSCQIVEVFFNSLIECKISISDDESYLNLLNMLFALHQSAFTEEHVLNVLFSVYSYNKSLDYTIWLPYVSAVLLYIFNRYNEDVLLLNIGQMANHPIFSGHVSSSDPLNSPVIDIIPEKAFVEFLCDIIFQLFQSTVDTKLLVIESSKKTWKYKVLSEFLSIIVFIFKSDKNQIIKTEFMCLDHPNQDGNKTIFEITNLSNSLLTDNLVVVLQWYELLLILKNEDINLTCFLQSNDRFSILGLENSLSGKNDEFCSINLATVKLGIFLLTCQYKKEIVGNIEIFKTFINFNLKEFLTTLHEPPVHNLLLEIEKSAKASNTLIQTVRNMFSVIVNNDNLLKKLLKCISYTHSSMKGEVLLISCLPQLLNNSSLSIASESDDLATKLIEYLLTVDDREEIKCQIKQEDVELLREQLKQSKYSSSRLIKCLNELSVRWYNIRFPQLSENRTLSFDRVRQISIDKQWFLTQVKLKCCNEDNSLNYIKALLLSHLSYSDIFDVMRSQNFNNSIIKSCFAVGMELTLLNTKVSSQTASFSEIFLAAWFAVLRHIEHLKSLLPRTHQVFIPVKREPSKKEIQYSQRMDIVFSDKEFTDLILCLLPAINQYLNSIERFQNNELKDISSESFKLLCDFMVLSLELIHWMVRNYRNYSTNTVLSTLQSCIAGLKIKPVSRLLSNSQIGSIVSCVFALTEKYENEAIKVPLNSLLKQLQNTETWDIIHSGHLISTLMDYFFTRTYTCELQTENEIISSLRQLLVILSQSQVLYNYLRIPVEVWKHVTFDDITVDNCITLNSLPESFLQDREILQNFVNRCMFIGWNNRMQFEECWMSLLIALNSLPEYKSSEEEMLALTQSGYCNLIGESNTVNPLAVNAITSLLIQTMYHPAPGNKIIPLVFHVSRNKYIDVEQCRWKQKLEAVNRVLNSKIDASNCGIFNLHNNNNVNLERLHNKSFYNFNQFSIEYLTFSCTNAFNSEEDVPISYHFSCLRSQYQDKLAIMKNLGIDTNSCIYFLIEFYNRWLQKPDNQSVEELLEILNSMLSISDLFVELSQFTWLLETGAILWKKYAKDDDAVCAYLTIIICKASSIATPVNFDFQKLVVKVLKTGLNSNKSVIRLAALHGILYLLESIFKRDTLEKTEIVSGDYKDGILSAAIVFVLENLDIDLIEKFTPELVQCVISVSFYLIENRACGENSDLVVDRLCKIVVRACKLKKYEIYVTIMQGFYNLILNENEIVKNNDALMQLIREIFSLSECITPIAVPSLQILTAIMYISEDFEDTRNSESSDLTFDIEKLIIRMEKTSVFFERIRKCSKQEARIVCAVLTQILNDVFPASEILNKIIVEFLSSSQPHIELVAEIVFKVFQNAIDQSQLSLIQDWVLTLLNNFSKYSVSKAVFYMNCFFISASTNPWLTALFPLITGRNGCLEYEDRKIMCLAAKQFYSQLTKEAQKTKFSTTFQEVEHIHPDSVFSEILKTIL